MKLKTPEEQKSYSLIGRWYNYLFFLAYKFECKVLWKGSIFEPYEVAVYLLTLIETLYFAEIQYFMFDALGMSNVQNPIKHIIDLLIILFMFFYNTNRFSKNDRYIHIVESFSNVNQRTILFSAILLALFVSLPWIIYGLQVYQVI